MPYPLISDEHSNLSETLKSTLIKDGKTIVNRNTFLINEKGLVEKVWLNVAPAQHIANILNYLHIKDSINTLQECEACKVS